MFRSMYQRRQARRPVTNGTRHATDKIGPCRDKARVPRRRDSAPRPKWTKDRPPTVDAE